MNLSTALGAGFGLRQPHYRQVIEAAPRSSDGAWIEVHSENFFADGGPSLATLEAARQHYPVSVHGVGLSLASADGLRDAHLAKLKRLVDRIEPVLVSEHLCWAAIGPRHLNDLLPLPYTEEALEVVTHHVLKVQDTLSRPILLENISSYLQFESSQMSEFEFLAELTRRTGCGVLLDLNNIYVNHRNFGLNVERELARLRPHTVKEIHLAGFSDAGDCIVDTHSAKVHADVWALYQKTLQRLGPVPTLVEWDQDIPPLDVLLGERDIAAAALRQAATHLLGASTCVA
jgi:hypothetical protein